MQNAPAPTAASDPPHCLTWHWFVGIGLLAAVGIALALGLGLFLKKTPETTGASATGSNALSGATNTSKRSERLVVMMNTMIAHQLFDTKQSRMMQSMSEPPLTLMLSHSTPPAVVVRPAQGVQEQYIATEVSVMIMPDRNQPPNTTGWGPNSLLRAAVAVRWAQLFSRVRYICRIK